MTFPRLAAASLAALLGLAAPALADIITSNNTGTTLSGGANFAVGQSVTTGAGGPWNTLSFNLLADTQSGPTPFAVGTLFLLSQPYAGSHTTLSNATPGYIADTGTITAGAWDFEDSVALQASTQYFFYMGSYVGGPDLLFSSGNPYAGGIAFQSSPTSSDLYFDIPTADLRFTLQGTQVGITDTPEPASALVLATALLALRRLRRPA